MTNTIYSILFLLLGIFELVSNSIYLTKSNGVTLARKQHQEIPANVIDQQMKMKVVCMLIVGIVSLFFAIYSFFFNLPSLCYFVSLGILSLYALCEFWYYRYWKTFGFFVGTVVLILIYWLNV